MLYHVVHVPVSSCSIPSRSILFFLLWSRGIGPVCVGEFKDVDIADIKVQVLFVAFDMLYYNGEVRGLSVLCCLVFFP